MTLGHIARLLSISNETAPVPVKGLRGSNLTASVLYRFAGCQKETTPKMEAAAHADGLPAGN